MRYLLLLLALPLLLGASGGPQVLDDLGQRRFAGGPWVSSYESDESDAWPAWDEQVLDPALVTDFSTAGWPREYGKICVTFSSGAFGEHHAIIDGRQDGDDPRPYLSVVNDGRIRFGIQTVGSIAGGEIIPGKTYTACVERSYGPLTTLTLDGVEIGTSTSLPAWDWHETVRLGSRYGGADPLGGTIASIQWRGLRFACDMTSDTCSDGRQIATTRPTPVPCEVAPGQWEMVPENTACISYRGLESWAATTSYLSYGAELDRSPWFTGGAIGHSVSVDRTGGTNLMCQNAELGPNSPAGRGQTTSIPTTAGPQTLACIARPSTGSRIRLNSGDSALAKIFPMEDTWDRYAHTIEVEEGQGSAISVYTLGQTCIDIAGCWLTKSDTPGRACWGGEAPVTCARDYHRMSTTGFPATTGEISWVMSLERVPDGGEALRGIVWADGASIPNRISLTGGGGIRIFNGETGYVTGPLSWEPGRSYTFRLIMADDEWRVIRDGELVGSTPPLGSMDWRTTVRLGDLLDGAISSLRVRSTE